MPKRVVFVAFFAIACSGSETTTTSPPSDGGGAKDAPAVTEDAGPTGDQACAAEDTKLDCGNCCAETHKPGYDVFAAALVACECNGTGIEADAGADAGAPGACATECATSLCSPSGLGSDAACSACVQKTIGAGGACQKYVVDTCKAEPDCLAQQQCVLACQTLK